MIAKRFLLLTALCWMASAGVGHSQDVALEPVTIQLRWAHQFQFAGYYAALEKGFYAEEGLEVTLREFDPAEGRVAPVLEGKAQYGVGDPGLLKLRAEGKPVVVVAQIFQHSPSILLTRRDSGVLDPYQLAGKRVMVQLDGLGDAALQAMLLETVGDLSKVTIVPHSYDPRELTHDKVDAVSAYLSNEPFLLKQRGVAVNIMDPRSYGIDFYGDNLFTTDKEITEHPERVEKVVRATLKGWEYALAHKDELIELIRKTYAPDLDREQLRYEAKVVDQMVVPDLIPIGDINPGRYRSMAETYHKLGMIESAEVPVGFLYNSADEGVVSLTAAERAWLKAHPDITLGYTDSLEPAVIAGPNGDHTGMLVDALGAIEQSVLGLGSAWSL